LGITLTKLGSNADAERELRAALALDPKKADVYRMLGRIALGGGRTDEAISLLQKAQQISDDPETRAILALARGDNARAIGEYEEAVRRDPESADLHNDLAASLARAGRDAEALAQYHEALRLAPRQYDAHMNLGALLSRQEKDAEAAEEFLAAAQESPRSAEPHVYVALVYAKLGRFRDAEREMTTAIQIDPVGSNTILTNAIHIPPAETNAEEYLAALRARGEG
jgi:Flp pilus assembly protein TadD